MSAANALNNIARAAVGLGAGASLLQASMFNVDGGYRAVMFDRYRGVQVSGERGWERGCGNFFPRAAEGDEGDESESRSCERSSGVSRA